MLNSINWFANIACELVAICLGFIYQRVVKQPWIPSFTVVSARQQTYVFWDSPTEIAPVMHKGHTTTPSLSPNHHSHLAPSQLQSPSVSPIVYNENPCASLLWHWSSRGQLALCNGRVGSKFNWPSEGQCQRSRSKWVFVFIPHFNSKYNQVIVSKLSRKSAICSWRSPRRLIVLVRSQVRAIRHCVIGQTHDLL